MNTTILLVGGPEHGSTYHTKQPNRVINTAHIEPVNMFDESIDALATVPIKKTYYQQEVLNFFGHYMQVWFHESLSDNGTGDRHRQRGRLLVELLLNDLAKTLLTEGPSNNVY